MKTIVVAADMAVYNHVNMNYWFYAHGEIASVTSMRNLSGARAAAHLQQLRGAH